MIRAGTPTLVLSVQDNIDQIPDGEFADENCLGRHIGTINQLIDPSTTEMVRHKSLCFLTEVSHFVKLINFYAKSIRAFFVFFFFAC